MEYDKLFVIAAGAKLWSIDLQMTIALTKDMIVKISGRSALTGEVIFVKRVEILFNFPGGIPGEIETKNEFGVDANQLIEYERPKLNIWTIEYK